MKARTAAEVPAFLVEKDGTRKPYVWEGGISYVTTAHKDGRWLQTIYTLADGVGPDGPLLFHAGDPVDITERMAEAERANRERSMAYFRKGWAYDEDMAAKDEEIARLRALLSKAGL